MRQAVKDFEESNEYLDSVIEKERKGEDELTVEERLIHAIYQSYSELCDIAGTCDTTNETDVQCFTIDWMRDAVINTIDKIRDRD